MPDAAEGGSDRLVLDNQLVSAVIADESVPVAASPLLVREVERLYLLADIAPQSPCGKAAFSWITEFGVRIGIVTAEDNFADIREKWFRLVSWFRFYSERQK
jgi:hypothetical protein